MDKQRKYEDVLFLTAYALWMTYSLAGISQWRLLPYVNDVRIYVQKTAYLLLVVQFLFRKQYTRRDILGIFLIIYSCIVSEHSVYNMQLIPVAIFVCFSANVNYRSILKCTFILQAVFMVITITASQIGILENLIWYDGDRVRQSLGYDYCGYPSHLLLFMTLMWFCIRKRCYLLEAVLFLGLNYAVFALTDSRTDFGLAVLGIIGYFLWTRAYKMKWIRVPRDLLQRYMFLLLAVGSIAAQIFYRPETGWMQRVNQILNGRLELGNQAIFTYGFSLFGSVVRWFGQGSLMANPARIYNYVDCSFLKEALTYGVPFLILLGAGFYLLGKKLSRQQDYALGWAVIVTLLYSTVNAHLCVLTFDVFILALGLILVPEADPLKIQEIVLQGTKSKVEGKRDIVLRPRRDAAYIKERLNRQTDQLASAASASSPERLHRKGRHILRILLMLAALGYVTVLQCQKTSDVLLYSSMHMWVICGILLALTVLCFENGSQRRLPGNILFRITVGFLLLSCLSDFIVDKYFQYSGFCVFVFGGLFCRAWYNMRCPGRILEEFKLACKIWFIVVTAVCIILFPAYPGICYSGMLLRADYFGISMLLMLAIFLCDLQKDRTGILNGIGAVVSLYMIWLTQQMTIVLAVLPVVLAYLGFWVCTWMRCVRPWRRRRIFTVIGALLCGTGAVLLLRIVLYQVSPIIDLQLPPGSELIEQTVLQSLFGSGLPDTFGSWLLNCSEYLTQTNLFGHKYLAEIAGKSQWAANGAVMNTFRYGAVAGIAYVAMTVVYLWKALRISYRTGNFFPAGAAVGCIAVGMFETVEMPFVHPGWLMFYMGLAWLLVTEHRKEQNEVSKHRSGQSDF